MNHIVNVCPLTKFGGVLRSLHEAGDDAIHWLEFTTATVGSVAEWVERWRTFPILHQTASWMDDHFVGQTSAIGQPTWPTQPSIPHGLVNE